MIEQMIYLCGAPGVGKSTLSAELTSGWDRVLDRTHPVPHSRLNSRVNGRTFGVELGVPRPDFPGTDALAMDIGPRALQFMATSFVHFGLGEGSRLATRPFLGGLVQRGARLLLVSLTAPQELLDERWTARGSKQNPSWRKGAATRARHLVDWAMLDSGIMVLHINTAEHTVTEQAAAVGRACPFILAPQGVTG